MLACAVQDTETLQSTIQLMAPHTSKLTQSQQARLVAAVGAAGAATQLSDLTLKGTASLLPSAAMLAGVHFECVRIIASRSSTGLLYGV